MLPPSGEGASEQILFKLNTHGGVLLKEYQYISFKRLQTIYEYLKSYRFSSMTFTFAKYFTKQKWWTVNGTEFRGEQPPSLVDSLFTAVLYLQTYIYKKLNYIELNNS